MADFDLAFGAISELAPLIEKGEVSPLDVTEAVLARIGELDGRLNSYITVTADDARDAARTAAAEIRSGNYKGPLHGIPLAVKDLYATRGVLTTFGAVLHKDWIPDFDAAVVERLRGAGAVLLGKNNLHEFAFGTTSDNPRFGAVHNPWKEDHHPGGSSGGSAAAVAGGLAFASIGSDTAASIRQPAACCGCVGLMPTYGRVSKFGALALSWSMDHVGPLTRTVTDAALVLQAIAGPDRRDPASAGVPVPDYLAAIENGVEGLRIGVAREHFFGGGDDDVDEAVEAALGVFGGLGAKLSDVTFPDIAAAGAAGNCIIMSEGAAYHARDLREKPEGFSEGTRNDLLAGNLYSAVQYHQAQRLRRFLSDQAAEVMRGLDAVVMATSPVPATPIATANQENVPLRLRNTMPFNVVSLPAISVPCGYTAKGLPVGLQIVGKAFDEATVLRVARAYEAATPWHTQHPAL